jgi:hypothetical protein
LPPKVSHPIPSSSNFVQDISRRLHNDLVIKFPKKIHTSTPSESALHEHQSKIKPGNVIIPRLDNIPPPASSAPLVQSDPVWTKLDLLSDAIIVKGTNEKRCILDKYEQKYRRNYDDLIVSKKKGKTTEDPTLLCTTRMRLSLDKWYRVSELTIPNIITTVIKEHCLTPTELKAIHLLNKNISNMVPKVTCWLKIDFYLLREPRYNYEQQECIDTQQVNMASAAMIHFGLDPGKFVRFLGGEYTWYFQDVQRTPKAVRDHVSPKDLAHMERILSGGCPAELTFKEPLSNKMEMISQGNSKSFNENPEIVKKMTNKEDRYTHVNPMDVLIHLLSPYLQHATQTMVFNEDKSPHLCYNATTTRKPTNIVMNQVTPVRHKVPITFSKVKQQ